ncbi:glycoside hydrolase family 3 protein [Desulfuromonas acetoxidans]|uniref:Glycoside hydrolase, family 3-like n=1 Tax=Desulfuromonas acetoxidans (strain DSM 684 / 11070) TaxID=281689 RepID=Q1K0E5_DESA6|nr:glycoside hydrolase family 3 protein [Desulfuromonas acetoxidans]EAT15996.1 glycoside hydrolase, family 3-like [Desulfuromonas acetoxidans DSM 684]
MLDAAPFYRCMFRLAFILFLPMLLALSGCQYFTAGLPKSTETPLEEKIGQLLLVGFRGQTLEQAPTLVNDIQKRHLGGVILFDYDVQLRQSGRNIASPSQLKQLTSDLQALSNLPLLIAIDQEGGRIARLKPAQGFPVTLSHRELAEQADVRLTFEHGKKLATTLATFGINLNLAPVVDLCSNPDNPVIARLDRCFSATPDQVTDQAGAYIAGHHQTAVLTCLKHFPGHGSSTTDSHQGFTDITQTWNEEELVPYRELIQHGRVDTIMTAHVFNSHLDANDPATLSRPIITGLLRGVLGYEGVVISDDLQMKAISAHYGLETAIEKALNAGVDMLVFGNNLSYNEHSVEQAVTIIQRLIKQGKVSEARIDESWRRITMLKRRLTVKEQRKHSDDLRTVDAHLQGTVSTESE